MRIRGKPWMDRELEGNIKLVREPFLIKGNWNEYFDSIMKNTEDCTPDAESHAFASNIKAAEPITAFQTDAKKRQLHIELGCGKGKFISQMAINNPEINYVAVERESKVIAAALRRSSGIKGRLAFINRDVTELSECFEPGEISRIYINFCDPWPNKKKWAKRRLTHKNYLALYSGLFGDNQGEIFFKTDSKVLFEFSIVEFTQNGWSLRNVTKDLHNSNFSGSDNPTDSTASLEYSTANNPTAVYNPPNNVTTEYEEKFISKGMPIYRLEAYL